MSQKDAKAEQSKQPVLKESSSISSLLADADAIISGAYRDLERMSQQPSNISAIASMKSRLERSKRINNSSSQESSLTSLTNSQTSDTSLNSTTSPEEPTTSRTTTRRGRRFMDEQAINKINRICDTVDQNLRSIGLSLNTSSGADTSNTNPLGKVEQNLEAINIAPNTRRSEIGNFTTPPSASQQTQRIVTPYPMQTNEPIRAQEVHVVDDYDEDVVVVSSTLPQVIDLCTPNNDAVRPVGINRNHLSSRRNLDGDVRNDEVVAARRRRTSATNNVDHGIAVLDVPARRRDTNPTINNHSVANLKPTNLDETVMEEPKRAFMCPVCMDSCLNRKPTSTRCGHVFCEQCIKQAVRINHKCPICNTKLSCSHLFRIYI